MATMTTDNKKKILVIEDDMMLNKIYQTKLGSLGYFAYPAYDGEVALKKVREVKPNLILLDLMLPKKNGYEVLEELKHDIELARIPVIIMSNLGQEAEIKRGMDLGAMDFLVKSNVKLETVVQKVEDALQKSAAQA